MADGCQADELNAAREAVLDRSRDRDSHARLSGATGTREAKQAKVWLQQQLRGFRNSFFSPDERSTRHRQIDALLGNSY
jgi:hypothetical protein